MRAPWLALPCLAAAFACGGCDVDLRRVQAIESPGMVEPQSAAMTDRATDHLTSSSDVAVIPLEHASLLLIVDDLAIYVDPTSPTVDDEHLPKANLVFVTDAHYDHLDPLALSHLRKEGTIVVGSPGAGAREALDVVMQGGQTLTLPHGVVATAVPAYNLVRGAGPGLLYHPPGESVAYVLTLGETRVLVTGDTECTPELKALTKLDAAFVSLNVPYAMTAAEASECVAAFRPKVVFPYAYRHAVPSTLDRAILGPGIEVRRREFYPRAAKFRARAYDAYAHGMWGLADDLLDEAQRLDPDGESDWRVKMTRQWLKEDENPWPW